MVSLSFLVTLRNYDFLQRPCFVIGVTAVRMGMVVRYPDSMMTLPTGIQDPGHRQTATFSKYCGDATLAIGKQTSD